MFTGIIDHCGVVARIEFLPNALQIWIRHSFTELMLGESIAIDGICLTVTHCDEDVFSCDISPETLHLTTAHFFQVGQSVNLERALQPSSRIGGHFVMGHIDQIAEVKKIDQVDGFIKLQFCGISASAHQFLVKKGSISVNGVSLTINEVIENGFNVMLIPHTLSRTNLGLLQEKSYVNIEFDMLARIFVSQSERYLKEGIA